MIYAYVASIVVVVLVTYWLYRFYREQDEAALKEIETKHHIQHLKRKNK